MPVYILQAGETENVKIGWAREHVAARCYSLQAAHYETLRIIREMPGASATERWLHVRFGAYRIRGEWFRLVPEMLTVVPPVLEATTSLQKHVKPLVARLTKAAGGASMLAARLSINPASLYSWVRVPSARVLAVEEITGIPRHELRPDLYPITE